MNAVDVALNLAQVVNLFAFLLLMKAVIKDRNVLRGFSLSGSFLTFVAGVLFEAGFLLMENYVGFVLGFAISAFWLMVIFFNFRNMLKERKK